MPRWSRALLIPVGRPVLGVVLLVLALWAGLPHGDRLDECITATWCIDSHTQPVQFALLIVATFALVPVGAWLGLRLALWMLEHRHRKALFGWFFVVLGGAGGTIWLLTVPPGDRGETLHVAIIAAVFGVAGVATLFWPGRRHDPLDRD